MQAVIMAGGLGKRLEPLTHIIPKPLLPVGEKSVLEITLNKLKSMDFKEIFLAVNYKSNLFESYFGDGSRFGLEIQYSKEKQKLGTAGPLRLLEGKIKEPFLVINGDILTNLDFRILKTAHRENRSDFTLVTRTIQLPLHYGVIERRDTRVLSITEKPVLESEINAGIYFLNPDILTLIPAGREFSMTDLIQRLLSLEKSVFAYPLTDYWLDIGQMKDYRKAQEDFKNGLI